MSTYQYYCNDCECTTILYEEEEQQSNKVCEHCNSDDIEFESIIV